MLLYQLVGADAAACAQLLIALGQQTFQALAEGTCLVPVKDVAVAHDILVFSPGGAGDEGFVGGVKFLLAFPLDDLRTGGTQAALGAHNDGVSGGSHESYAAKVAHLATDD